MNVFDARCKIGRHVRHTSTQFSPHTAEDLLADMDHHGIAEALVLDCLSQECSPADGNPRILEVTRGHPRLHPAWSALPPGTDEQPAPDELVRAMRRHKVAGLWMFPRQYHHPLTDWCVDELLSALAEANTPLFISYGEIGRTNSAMDQTNWPEVVELCQRWPTLNVVASEYRFRRSQRTIYRALDTCANLHIELSGYWLHHGIEYLCRHWGSKRIIFGSNWPHLGHGLTLTPLTCADISSEEKENIAGNNLRRLIRWCQPNHPHVELPPPADSLVAWGRTGNKPKTITLYDNHGHLGGGSCHYHVPDGDAAQLVAEMDRFGIAQCCVFSLSGVFSDECYGNDRTMEAVSRYPDRFIGFTLLNPHRDPDEMWSELQRCAAGGLRGVKLIPHYQGYPPEGPNIDVACQWAHEHRQFILNHHWGSPAQMERLVSKYPDACFFTGHTTLEYAKLMRRHMNLYVCSCPVLEPRIVEKVVEAIGAERFLFGSDLSDLPIAWGFGPILFARISEAEKRKILGENLKNLMQRYSLPEESCR